MKKILLVMTLVIGSMTHVSQVIAQDGNLESLRGHKMLNEDVEAPDIKQWQRDRDPIARDYVQQPPLIPHKTNGYKINLKFNKCLTCHSWANYRKAGATKISQTHFADRDTNVHANVAARRYFCNQCHVSQVDAQPLVKNTFESVKTIKTR